jgi:hypothetical protein
VPLTIEIGVRGATSVEQFSVAPGQIEVMSDHYELNWMPPSSPPVGTVFEVKAFALSLLLGQLDLEVVASASNGIGIRSGGSNTAILPSRRQVPIHLYVNAQAVSLAEGEQETQLRSLPGVVDADVVLIDNSEGGTVGVFDRSDPDAPAPIAAQLTALPGQAVDENGDPLSSYVVTMLLRPNDYDPIPTISAAQQFPYFVTLNGVSQDGGEVFFTTVGEYVGASVLICQPVDIHSILPTSHAPFQKIFRYDAPIVELHDVTYGDPGCAGYVAPAPLQFGFESGLSRNLASLGRRGLKKIAAFFLPTPLLATHGGIRTLPSSGALTLSDWGALLPTDPTQSTAVVPAGTVGTPTNITIQARIAAGVLQLFGGDDVAVAVTGANSANLSIGNGIVDNGNGTYTATYTPTAPGTDQVAITIAESTAGMQTAIAGSPLSSPVFAPSSLAEVRVCSSGAGGTPTYSTLADAVAAVSAGGLIRLCSGLHQVNSLSLGKALTIEPEPGAAASVTGGLVPAHPSGTVVIRGLTFVNSAGHEVGAQGSYADVLLESATFIESSASFGASSVADAHVVVRDVDFLGGTVSGLSFSGVPRADVLDSYFEGHTSSSSLQYQSGSACSSNCAPDGMILRNRFEECGWRGCIRVVLAGTVLIADNEIRTTARKDVFQQRFGSGVIAGLVADGEDVTAERNRIEGVGPVDPNDPDSYPMIEFGALTAWYGLGSTTFRDNEVINAGVGIGGFARSLVASGNIVRDVHTALRLSLDDYSPVEQLDVQQNDFEGYVVSLDGNEQTPAGGAVCNWWGAVSGPINPVGVLVGVYTPWATAPIAGTGRAC